MDTAVIIAIVALWASAGAAGWTIAIQQAGFGLYSFDWMMLPVMMICGPFALVSAVWD